MGKFKVMLTKIVNALMFKKKLYRRPYEIGMPNNKHQNE